MEMPSACPELGWVVTARTVSDRDVAIRAYRDVLVAGPGSQYRPRLPTDKLSGTAVVQGPLKAVIILVCDSFVPRRRKGLETPPAIDIDGLTKDKI